MGCGNCGSGASGKPGGCKGNGGCTSGGCNRLNVFDWLSELPLSGFGGTKSYPVIEVTFNKGSRKDFYKNNANHILEKGEWIAVEGVGGFDVGQVSLTGELVKLQQKKYGANDEAAMKRVLRKATEQDIEQYNKTKEREQETMVRARAMARTLGLEMKIAEVELQADGKKATFFYTADGRVDFRELIKVFATDFKVRVEMKQIGARQESGKVGGIGSCGRELCCSTWLTDFKSVNTTAARYQNLSINQTKLSGQCGRLKCCLNYELDTYLDALSVFPDHADSIQTIKGNASLQKRDIFKNLMWYSFSDSSKQYPLSIERVKEIQALNKQGIRPEELQPVEIETTGSKASVKIDMGYVNDVGQITLKSLEKGSNKKRNRDSRDRNRPQQGGGGNAQGNRPQRPQQAGGRPQGDRPPRPQGEGGAAQSNRPPRPQGEGRAPQGNRPPRPQQGGEPKQGGQPQERKPNQQSNRPPRPPQGGGQPRPQGNRPQGNRPLRPEGGATPRNRDEKPPEQ